MDLDGILQGLPENVGSAREALRRLGRANAIVGVLPDELGSAVRRCLATVGKDRLLTLAKVVTEPEPALLVRVDGVEHREAGLWTDRDELRLDVLAAFVTQIIGGDVRVHRVTRGLGGEPALICLNEAEAARLRRLGVRLAAPGEPGTNDLVPADYGV